MQNALMLVVTLLLALSLPGGVKASPEPGELPVVHAVLFYSPGCPYCSEVMNDTLPPLQEQYQSQLSILLVELATLKDIDNLYSLGATFGLTKEQVAVPYLLIDQTPLIGADEINTKLAGLVKQYLATGGLDTPDIPLLNEMSTNGIDFTAYDPTQPTATQVQPVANSTGMSMAWVIMVFMLLALIISIILILRAFQGKPVPPLKKWLEISIPVLSLIGLGAAIYLTYVEITHTRAMCGPVGDCNTVQSSPYAKLFGLIPIGLVGAVGYIAILVAWLWRRTRHDSFSRIAGPVMFGMALFGTLFSVYLTYLELFVIHAVCIWCLTSAVIITVLMLLSLPQITQWLAIADEEDQSVE
ncbi:MAG: vitamin K epoxide reductase [Anaerolineae bacterium]|nr:vitamin K epoxide reductase [Anaerolineae bacterium]